MIFKLIFMVFLPIYCGAFDCNFIFPKSYEKIEFSVNSTIILSCTPQFSSDIEDCKASSITMFWSHSSKHILEREDRRKTVSQGRELVIFYARSSDQGKYVCDTENKNGPLNKTFILTMIEANSFHNSIDVNLLPQFAKEEIQDHIYWLPEMMRNDMQQNHVRNPGEEKEFYGAYYVNARNTTSGNFKVDWFFQYEGDNIMTKIEGSRYVVRLSEKPCSSVPIMPRKVSGQCYFSYLIIPKINDANQGLYHSVAKMTPHSLAGLNMTFSLRLNIGKMADPEGDAHMTFNLDTKVCKNDYFDFKCKMSSDNNYFMTIKKAITNLSEITIAETIMESVKIISDGKVISNGNFIPKSEVTYRLVSVSVSDAGSYTCVAIPLAQMTENERGYFEVRRSMELIVKPCISAVLPSRTSTSSSSSSWHTVLIWPLIVVSLITFLSALSIYFYHYYSTSCLIKTVIIQHPNKLYVPHDDTFSPLLLPHVTIRTSHRFRRPPSRTSSRPTIIESRSSHKPISRPSVVVSSSLPFSQKLSRYFQKSCIFNYRRVNNSPLALPPQQIETICLATADSSKSSSNSTKDDNHSQELIVQNNSRIQYKLPSNIGWVFSRDSLIVGSKIGEGAFGIVFDGIAKVLPQGSSPIEVAIKTLHDSFGDEDLINLVKEMEMLKLIGHHRHIIALYGAYVDHGHPYMVMELAKNGNLRDFLRSHRTEVNAVSAHQYPALGLSSISLLDLLRFGMEIATGMEFLSSKMIIHRDLAARNILVDQYFEIKIADFGLTRAVENYYRKSTDGRLPIKWMAPECLLDRVYTVKSDVWSFGIVLWEIFTMGQTPYPCIQPDSMHQALRNGFRNEKPDLCSQELYNVMLMIWNDDPVERPSFSELVAKMTQLQLQEMVRSSQVNVEEQPPSVIVGPSQEVLVKDYLELSSTQCYSTTNV